jgi:hypothetical protein
VSEIIDLAARRTRTSTKAAVAAIEYAVHEVMQNIKDSPDALAVICSAARSLADHNLTAALFGAAAQMVIDRMLAIERDQANQPDPAA